MGVVGIGRPRLARQAAHDFAGDDRADRLAGRMDQVDKMGLPAEIVRRRIQHVVGEDSGELRADAAIGPRHRREHVAGIQVGLVELVDDARLAGDARIEHRRIVVDGLQEVALLLVAGDQARRIPAEVDAFDLGLGQGVADFEVLRKVVKGDLRRAGAFDGVDQGIDIVDRLLKVFRMVDRFVDHLDEQQVGLVLQRAAGIGVDVVQHLLDVVGLGGDGLGIGAHDRPRIQRRKAGRLVVGIADLISEGRIIGVDRRQQDIDTAFARGVDQIVFEVGVVVGDQIADRVGILPVAPRAQPHAVPAHAGKVRHVLVDQLLAIGVDQARHAVIAAGKGAVVGAEQPDFLVVGAPADKALGVDIDGPAGRSLVRCRPRGLSGGRHPGQHGHAHQGGD